MSEYSLIARAMRRDPAVGKRISFCPMADLHGNLVRLPFSASLTALLYVRRCAESAFHEDVRLLEKGTAGYPELRTCVVFSATHPETLKTMIRDRGYRSVFLHDRTGEVSKALNAFGIARFYLFDKEGRLLYIEKLVEEVRAILDSASVRAASQTCSGLLPRNSLRRA
jgi:hypothetical protein